MRRCIELSRDGIEKDIAHNVSDEYGILFEQVSRYKPEKMSISLADELVYDKLIRRAV